MWFDVLIKDNVRENKFYKPNDVVAIDWIIT